MPSALFVAIDQSLKEKYHHRDLQQMEEEIYVFFQQNLQKVSEIEENATCCLEKPDQTRPDGAESPLASEPGPPLRRTTRLWGSPATQVNCLDCQGRGSSGDWAYPEVALRSLRRPLGQDLLALGSRRWTLGSLGRTLRSQDRLALGSLKRTLGSSRRRTRWSWGRIPEGRERLGLLLIHDHEATPEWWMADG